MHTLNPHRFSIHRLKCFSALTGHFAEYFFQNVSPGNFFSLEKAVGTYNETATDTTLATFVSLNKNTVLNQPEFIDLNEAEVQSIISSDEKRVWAWLLVTRLYIVCFLGKIGKEVFLNSHELLFCHFERDALLLHVNLSQLNAFVRFSPKLKSWHSQALSNGQSTMWSKGVKYFQICLQSWNSICYQQHFWKKLSLLRWALVSMIRASFKKVQCLEHA